MSGRIKTLLLYSTQVLSSKGRQHPWSRWDVGAYWLKTAERKLRRMRRRFSRRPVASSPYDALSYVNDWKDAICEASQLQIKTVDIGNLWQFWQVRKEIRSYPLIIILHSATGDDMSTLRRAQPWFQDRRGRLVVFVGNEYDLLEDKIGFLRETGAEFICSQLPEECANWLYADCHAAKILTTPHALNPDVYSPSRRNRPWDVGFRGDLYGRIIGDNQRDEIIDFFSQHGARFGLEVNIRVNQRMSRREWSTFLGDCQAIIGAESGSYYLDRRGSIIESAKRFIREHRGAAFDEVYERFFRAPSVEHISGKCVSSRHFEPIGTKTCQILIEGDYNGILQADEQYIPVKKDLSNIDEAIRKFRDTGLRQKMVQQTYDYVMQQHTYQHRVASLISKVAA